MKHEVNPYAPPAEADPAGRVFSGGGSGFRIEGTQLIAEKGASLPPLCVWNGEPADGPRVRKKLTWMPPWTAVFAISPLIYLIVFMIVRKTGQLEYGIGKAVRTRQKSALFIGFGGTLFSVALLVASALANMPLLSALAALLFLVVLVVATLRWRALHLAKIDKTHIYLTLRPEVAQAFARYG